MFVRYTASVVSPMRCLVRLAVPLALLAAAGCAAIPDLTRGLFGEGGAFAPGPRPPLAPSATADGVARAVEEADVVKVVGDRLYVLNRFKGLLIIDVSNPDAPRLLGQLDLLGRGVEMYVVEPRAYVLLSADYYLPYLASAGAGAGVANGIAPPGGVSIAPPGPIPPAPEFTGSQIAIVDVSDPARPALRDKLNLVGYANESRRVGDVIYVVGSNNIPFTVDVRPGGAAPNEGFVASVNVADPENIIPVERRTFSGQGLVLHVSGDVLLSAGQEYDPQSGESFTRVQYVDVSDPAGRIGVRGSVAVPGQIRNRFYLDAFEGALRIVTDSFGFGFRSVRVFTYDLSNPDAIAPLAEKEIKRGESLEAVRFDGPRGYAVTFLRIDPLFVLDLRDPRDPKVVGQLEVPGFSTHIEPRGDRLIAVGVDDTDGRRPAVAYYDVSDPSAPQELGRIILGPPGSFTESEATYDEKAFKIVDELGLIAVPFHHVEFPETPRPPPPPASPPTEPQADGDSSIAPEPLPQVRCINAVQLVDYSDTALSQRGWFEHDGRVERVGVVGERVFALSQTQLQTVNIANRDQPAKSGEVQFFTPDERALFDDCGYYVVPLPGPIDIFPGFPPLIAFLTGGPLGGALPRVIEALLNDATCGAMGAVPLLMLPVGLVGLRLEVRRRSRPRR